jgi:penicillin G amidase
MQKTEQIRSNCVYRSNSVTLWGRCQTRLTPLIFLFPASARFGASSQQLSLDLRHRSSHSAAARAIRYLNIAIAVLIFSAAVVVYWYGWRPLPSRSGAVPAPVASTVSVTFDTLGVPHIRAASIEDALYTQGYVTAQDRLWQMEGLRRSAAGDLAEILGPAWLQSDQNARRLRTRRIAEAAYISMPAADRAEMAAYARGVNEFIETHRSRLPLEFSLLKYQPRPWSVVDSVMVTLYMFEFLTTTWQNDVLKGDMLAAGDAAKVNFLFPSAGDGSFPGSNAWAISGKRTVSGKPLLSNDMHLAWSLPGIWYMTSLQAPGLNVSGVALPGAPGIMVGHNSRIAWGITNLQFDVQDLYIEQLDERTGRYLYRGQMEQARREQEIIRVKGQPAVNAALWVTRHGPVTISENGRQMALRWTAAEPGTYQYPFLDADRAGNWQEFLAAASRIPGVGLNLIYADVDGNIGYHVAGRIPARKGFRGDVPVDGTTGEYEWNGFIPFDQLPSAFNPPEGILASANQNTFPADYPYPVNGNFAPPGRAKQIRDRLLSRARWQPQQMLTVQMDVYSAFHKFLAEQMAAAYGRKRSRMDLDQAAALLRGWNGQMDRDMAAPFVAALAQRYVQAAAADTAAPNFGSRYDFTLANQAIEKLLRERPAGWFGDFDEMLVRALGDAVDEARRMQGPDPAKWKYGNYLKIGIINPVTHQIPLVGSYFDIQPVPMSGAGSTVKQTTRALAPSMRMTADLGDWEKSLLNIQTGQSGQVLSRYYKDEWNYYYYGRSYPMQFNKVDAKSTMTFTPRR